MSEFVKFHDPAPESHGGPRLHDRVSCVIAFLLPVLLLLPFLNKAYHVDDHVFVWVAQQIAESPLDFFGFEVDYGYRQVPMHEVNHNPPGVSYGLAAAGIVGGWREAALHLAMALAAGLAGLGMYLLARDMSSAPLLAACAAILTPAFMVSASSLMTDVPLLACYVWAIYLWRRGLIGDRPLPLLAASVLMAAAFLCKYYGITLIPLLFAYSIIEKRAIRSWCWFLLIPLFVFGGFQLLTYRLYGVTTFADATAVALNSKWRAEEIATTRWVLTLAFIGGCYLPLALYFRPQASWRPLGIGAAAATALTLPLLGGFSAIQLLLGTTEPYAWPELAVFAVTLFVGGVLLVHASKVLYAQRDADAALLAMWILGTVVFTAAVNHYVSARTILPIAPALAIVLLRDFPSKARRLWRLAPACLVCVWMMLADYEGAAHGRAAARDAVALAREEGVPLYHVAFWGFEYYVTEAGSRPFSFEKQERYDAPIIARMEPGALLVVHSHGTKVWRSPPKGFEPVDVLRYPFLTRLTLFGAQDDAGFFAHKIGYLPFKVGAIAPEEFLVLRWTGNQAEGPSR